VRRADIYELLAEAELEEDAPQVALCEAALRGDEGAIEECARFVAERYA
jgi:hypothetical protein